jgi:fatty-acid desaturase
MQTHAWHRTVISLAGILVFLIQVYSGAPLYWFALSYFIYYIIAIASTVGYHRLFNHATFECNVAWHWVFGIIGCIGLNSSPFHWSVVHSGHHKYSDTINDPYDSTWRFFFRLRDRSLKVFRNDMRLARQHMHQFLMTHSFTISFLYAILTFVLFGINGIAFLYVIPVGLYIVGVGIHTMNAHKNAAPRNIWWMEFIVPMGGEWLHKTHHKSPWLEDFRTETYHYDIGYKLIELIRTDKSSSTT